MALGAWDPSRSGCCASTDHDLLPTGGGESIRMSLTVDLPRLDARASDRDLVTRARDLIPRLRQRAAEVEIERRLPDSTIAELQSAGLFKLFVPRRLGGQQASVRTYLDVTAEIARGC